MTVVVGTTLSTMAMTSGDEVWKGWLHHAGELRDTSPEPVEFFAAIQVDARGLDPFDPLLSRLDELDGQHWVYSLDDGRTEVTMTNRWRHITAGQNLVNDYCSSRPDVTHLLFMAADCTYPPDALSKLLALDHPYVGGWVPTYGFLSQGAKVAEQYRHDYGEQIMEHMPTAAFVLLARDVFRQLRWRWDGDEGMSDDPCLYRDAREYLGIQAVVHHGVVGHHYPACIGSYTQRGFDTTVVR